MAVKKNWEHHVSLPAKGISEVKLNPNLDENMTVDVGDRIPVVVIFGWMGSQDKHLKVYSRIYEDMGFPTLRYIVPQKLILYHSNKMMKVGEEMASAFQDQKLNKNPIIFHLFSNGGAYLYQVFVRALTSHPEYEHIKGVIFDSAPTERSLVSFYRAIGSTVTMNYFKGPTTLLLAIYCRLKRWLDRTHGKLTNTECIVMDPHQNLMNEKNKWPQLFIYSEADKITSKRSVESFAAHRRSLGVDVSMKCFHNSPHVQHYLKDKSSYVRNVVKFLNKCLKK